MRTHHPDLATWLLCLMVVAAPAVGWRSEELLQDTLKSMVVAGLALATSFAFFWPDHRRLARVKMHPVLFLPLMLMLYALGSMAWSHTYLGGVEAVRWLVFSLILWLGMNVLTAGRIGLFAWSVHLGAVMASLWAALQFWFDWPFFAQGPNPASTFVNRNFFAEFVVCTLPFSALLLTRVRDKTTVYFLTFSLGFNVVALMMTGTRSALAGLMILAVLLPLLLWRYRAQWMSGGWSRWHLTGLIAVLLITISSLGSLSTDNRKLVKETGQGNALDRAFARSLTLAQAQEYKQGSFSVRARMWAATGRMMAAHPLAGVGAGAWEVQVPLFQEEGAQIETDYYAHNEFLQLLAEYGLTGWLFLVLLLAYLLRSARLTWGMATGAHAGGMASARAFTLASLLVLLLVSNAGFPWRMATTGALFALNLALLAATDPPLKNLWQARRLVFTPRCSVVALSTTAVCTGLGLYIAQQAYACEGFLIQSTKTALGISASGDPRNPRWDTGKARMIHDLKQGIAINPHYRKLTPITADALASWGDWANATWVWESVLESRPHVVVMLANAARGRIQAGQFEQAQSHLDRALRITPKAASLASLQVMLWSRTGKVDQAMQEAKTLLASGFIDNDLMQTAYHLGIRQKKPELAILALQMGIKAWPNRAVDGWLKLGDIYDSAPDKNSELAQHAYTEAFNTSLPGYKTATWAQIPPSYQTKITIN